jgi:hypothetical protein
MVFKLSAKQQAFVYEANRRAADAAKSGRAPSQHFIDKCNSEAGVEFARVQVPFVKDASQDIVRVMSNNCVLSPISARATMHVETRNASRTTLHPDRLPRPCGRAPANSKVS